MSRVADVSDRPLSPMSTWIRHPWQAALRFILGPWPIRPLLTATSFFIIEQSAAVALAQSRGDSAPRVSAEWLPWTLAGAGLLAASLWGMNRVLHGIAEAPEPGTATWRGRGRYLLILLAAVVIFRMVYAITGLPSIVSGQASGYRAFGIALSVTAVFGWSSDRLGRQVRRTQQALDLVEEQRQQLLDADEGARRDVANYLHDNVQADLVLLSIQLRSVAERMPSEYADPVRSVIDELESVRLLDIRTASRRLSPDLKTIGIAGALRELAASYSGSMSITLDCAHTLDPLHPDVALATYRVVEQGLLNAAVHARAHSVAIAITRMDERATRRSDEIGVPLGNLPLYISVTNDGIALAPQVTKGTGAAVIQAWVSRFHGSWGLESLGDTTQLWAVLREPRPH